MRNINDELRTAAARGDEKNLTSLLLNSKGNPLAEDSSGWTALMYAALDGHTSCVQTLLPLSDALAKNSDGMTALMHAALGGHTSCIQVLLPFSDTLAKTKNGATASSLAIHFGHESAANRIDAYTLTKSESSAIHSFLAPGKPCKAQTLRI